jgi:hypothetical protein
VRTTNPEDEEEKMMKGIVVAVCAVVLLCTPAAHSEDSPVKPEALLKEAPDGLDAPALRPLASRSGELIDETFSAGNVPPSGWTGHATHATNNWVYDSSGGVDDSHMAKVGWAACGSSPCQDEWIMTPSLDLSSLTDPVVTFSNMGSFYYSCTVANAEFKVYLSTVGATPADLLAGTEIYDFCADPNAANWTWLTNTIDLSAWGTESSVYIGFNYVGDDGADHHLDAIKVGESPSGACCTAGVCTEGLATTCLSGGGEFQGEGTTCATTTCSITVAGADTCADAEAAPGTYGFGSDTNYSSSSASLTDDYNSGGSPGVGTCTYADDTAGPDAVFYFDVTNGSGAVDLALTPSGWDAVLWITTDCSDPFNNMPYCADSAATGGSETLSLSGLSNGRYYVIVDGYGGGNGDFTLTSSSTTVPVTLLKMEVE